jgi:aspartate aminotransferase
MTDDIYEHLVYDDFQFVTAAQVEPALYERTLTINGVSKAYCMTGWRIGFAGGPADLIKAMSKVQSQSTSNPSSVSQGRRGGPERLPGLHRRPQRGLQGPPRLGRRQAERMPGPHLSDPRGRVLRLPLLCRDDRQDHARRQGDRDDTDFVSYLLEAEGVAVVQGEAFGLSPYFRISYATSTEALEEACRRIKRACEVLA